MLKKLSLLSASLLIAVLSAIALPKLIDAVDTNLIANSSVENSTNNLPDSWTSYKTGNNTTAFNYLNTGHTGGHSLQAQMTNRKSGQAEWVSAPVSVAPSTKYSFSDWYQSSVQSTVVATITKTDGSSSKFSVSEPASSTWKQASLVLTTPAKTASLTVRQYINRVGQITTDDYSLEGPTVIAPTVNVTAPQANSTVSGTQTVTAIAAGGSSTVKNVQFQMDGVNLGAADKTVPYSVSWNTKNSAFGPHSLTAIVTTASGLSVTSAGVPVNVNNATAPTVTISSPTTNATISGNQTITASAADSLGVTSVQFKLNSNDLGAPITAAPYTTSWDTTTVADGSYTLTALATNQAGLSTTSAGVTVIVQNQVSTPPPNPGNGPNILLNPSLESSANGTTPDDWLSSNWGTNTSTFSYLNTGHDGSHSVEAQTTKYTDGAANWYYADLPITPGVTYQYTNWYKSNVDTEVDAEVTMTDGTINYYYLGTVLSNTNWTKFSSTFTPPAGAKSMAIYQILAKVGYIITDDYSINTYTPAPLNRGIVSVSFDDGWANQYSNALPSLQQYGIPATFNIITDSSITNPDPEYMNLTQIKNLMADGHEIASHSETHPDLTTVSQAKLVKEMGESQSILQNALGVMVTDFAYPFGAYNTNTLAVGSTYYQTQRTVNAGYNTKDNLNLTQLKIYEVDSNISQAQVQGWINGAIAQKSWLILVFHEIAVTPTDPTDTLYDTQPTDFAAEMAYLHNAGVATETVHQAVNEILPQL